MRQEILARRSQRLMANVGRIRKDIAQLAQSISERTSRTSLRIAASRTRGQMKALDENVLEAAKELRERMRTRSIQDILMHLKFTSDIDVSKISASTLNRHLNRIGATKGKNYSEQSAFFSIFRKSISTSYGSQIARMVSICLTLWV